MKVTIKQFGFDDDITLTKTNVDLQKFVNYVQYYQDGEEALHNFLVRHRAEVDVILEIQSRYFTITDSTDDTKEIVFDEYEYNHENPLTAKEILNKVKELFGVSAQKGNITIYKS